MKHITFVLLLATGLSFTAALAKDPSADPLAGAFFPPELIGQLHEQIGMNQEQMESFRARVEKAQPRFEEFRQRLERESAALAALAKQDRVDEPKLLAQLNKVLDAEREVKVFQMGLLAAIKNLLTPEQQAKLREIAKDGGKQFAEDTRKRLTEKMERVKEGAQKLADTGRDPSDILRTMEEKFKPLIEGGKVNEAEAELDRALEQLKQELK